MINKFKFFKEAIRTMKTSGTITPSSKYLVDNLIENIDFNTVNTIVEFGSGSGVVTRNLLKKMKKKSVLVSFEINATFYLELKKIKDQRLIVLNASAENIINELLKLKIYKIDCCISSLPLSNMPKQVCSNIITDTYSIVKKNGTFNQFQYTLKYYKFFKKIFKNKNVKIKFELRNFPPAFIYQCIKKL